MTEHVFNIHEYKLYVSSQIKKLFRKESNDDILTDILLDSFIQQNIETIRITKNIKQIQMKIGKIWQIAIGSYKNFIDLGEGDKSGLDVVSHKRKVIIELKNRYNASAKKTNYDKIEAFIKVNPEYTGIYGVLNDKVCYYSGMKLLDYIFESDKNEIIQFLITEVFIINYRFSFLIAILI